MDPWIFLPQVTVALDCDVPPPAPSGAAPTRPVTYQGAAAAQCYLLASPTGDLLLHPSPNTLEDCRYFKPGSRAHSKWGLVSQELDACEAAAGSPRFEESCQALFRKTLGCGSKKDPSALELSNLFPVLVPATGRHSLTPESCVRQDKEKRVKRPKRRKDHTVSGARGGRGSAERDLDGTLRERAGDAESTQSQQEIGDSVSRGDSPRRIAGNQLWAGSDQSDTLSDTRVAVGMRSRECADGNPKQQVFSESGLLVIYNAFSKRFLSSFLIIASSRVVAQLDFNLQLKSMLYASATAFIRSQLALMIGLECDRVSLKNQAHADALRRVSQIAITKYLETLDSTQNLSGAAQSGPLLMEDGQGRDHSVVEASNPPRTDVATTNLPKTYLSGGGEPSKGLSEDRNESIRDAGDGAGDAYDARDARDRSDGHNASPTNPDAAESRPCTRFEFQHPGRLDASCAAQANSHGNSSGSTSPHGSYQESVQSSAHPSLSLSHCEDGRETQPGSIHSNPFEMNELSASLRTSVSRSVGGSNAASGVVDRPVGLSRLYSRLRNEFYNVTLPTHPFIWRRMGFQGNNPITDFRASGMCGLLLLTYTATSFPGLLLDGSYAPSRSLARPDVVQDLLGWISETDGGGAGPAAPQGTTSSKQYRYPFSTAIISVSHQFFTHPMIQEMMTSHTDLLDIFVSDVVGALLSHAAGIARDFFASLSEAKGAAEGSRRKGSAGAVDYSCVCSARELIRVLPEEDRAQVLSSKEELLHWYNNNLRYRLGEIALAEEKRRALSSAGDQTFVRPCVSAYLKPREVYKTLVSLFDHKDYQFLPLSAVAPPQLGGCILETCVGLVRVLDKRLAGRPLGQQYLEFNTTLRQVFADFESLVRISRYARVYSVTEVLRILEEGWG